MPTTLDDLQTIKARIADQVQEAMSHIEQTRNELAEQQHKLLEVQKTKGETQSALGMQQAEVARLTSLVHTYTQEALHAIGTSLQAEKERHLFAAQDDLGAAQADLKRLGAALETAVKEERNLQEQCQALASKLDELAAKHGELTISYHRFDAEHANHVREIGLDVLDEIDNEIANLQSELDQVRAHRLEAQAELASNLRQWPQIAEQTLATVGSFEPGPDARLLAARLAMLAALDEASPGAQQLAVAVIPLGNLQAFGGLAGYRQAQARLKAQNGDFVHADPLLQNYEAHVTKVERILAELRAKEQEVQATALIRQQTTS